MEVTIDIERLRSDLIDYFGSAMYLYPVAVMDVTEVEMASPEQLLIIARRNGFDLNDYIVKTFGK